MMKIEILFLTLVLVMSCGFENDKTTARTSNQAPQRLSKEKTVLDILGVSKDSYDIVLHLDVIQDNKTLKLIGFQFVRSVDNALPLSARLSKFDTVKPDSVKFGCFERCEWSTADDRINSYSLNVGKKMWKVNPDYEVVTDTMMKCVDTIGRNVICVVCDEARKYARYYSMYGKPRETNFIFNGRLERTNKNKTSGIKYKLEVDAYTDGRTIELEFPPWDSFMLFRGRFASEGDESTCYKRLTTVYYQESRKMKFYLLPPDKYKSNSSRMSLMRKCVQTKNFVGIEMVVDSWDDVVTLFCTGDKEKRKIKVPRPLGGEMMYEMIGE